jgi:hypothetical protein
MSRTVQIIPVLAAMALAVACGGGSNPASPSSPSLDLDMPPKAEIDVTVGLDAVYGPSADPGYAAYLSFTAAMSESAGLGAHLNYVRGDFFEGDVLAERYDLSATQIVETTGSNRLEPNGHRSFLVLLRFSAPADLIRATFMFTDDQGHEHHLVGTIHPDTTAVAAAIAGQSEAPSL